MTITSRAYATSDDLHKIQTATARWIAEAGFCGSLHVDDIALRLFNGMRRYAPQEIVRLWENDDGTLLGWAMIYPRWDGYEALLHPAYRETELALEILDWAETETRRWMQQEGRGHQAIRLNVFKDDAARIALLLRRGYQQAEQHSTIGQRALHEPIPDAPLPDGFSIRPMAGIHEVEKLIEVQNVAFDWKWTADEYIPVLNSPGYGIDRQMVVVTPNGHFAAFCYVMLDAHNKIGMFEDVGTHPQFQRMGLGRALLYASMKHMIAEGMETVFVPYHVSVGAGKSLYESLGFQPKYNVIDYIKPAS